MLPRNDPDRIQITFDDQGNRVLARIHRWTRMDDVRTEEGGGEGGTGAMIRARIRVDGRLAAVCRRFGGRRWRPTVAVVSEMAG